MSKTKKCFLTISSIVVLSFLKVSSVFAEVPMPSGTPIIRHFIIQSTRLYYITVLMSLAMIVLFLIFIIKVIIIVVKIKKIKKATTQNLNGQKTEQDLKKDLKKSLIIILVSIVVFALTWALRYFDIIGPVFPS